MRSRIAIVAAIMLTACSGGPRTEPQAAHRATPPTIAALPEPSIEALQELSDENSLLSERSIYYRNVAPWCHTAGRRGRCPRRDNTVG